MNNHNHNQHHSQNHDHHQHQHGAPAHPHGGSETAAQLVVATDPAHPVAGQPVTLRLMIHAADGTMARDFDVVHDEKVHLVVVRDGLDQFAHIHPTVDAKGNLTVTHTFPAGGIYRLFADYAPAGGGHATAKGIVTVGGNSPPAPALAPNAPGEVVADDVHATVAAAPLTASSPARVTFALRGHEHGEPVRLEPYMGELGHLMFVGVGTGRYVHVHPASGDAARGTVEFEAHFPEPGLYKGWGQFKQDGRVRVVPFVLRVE
ncbi:MAG TPA: hypothetical protein VEA69_09545 [Tepidisphaeraceae bacterium]|nr:hypothetical protein [Tepidisphaeraceae bacterium]